MDKTIINVLKTEYWNRSDAFLLPLTGLSKDEKFVISSYLFWGESSIHDYKLTLVVSGEGDKSYFYKKRMFPILDRNGYLVENYEIGGRSIFILDMSDWADDIDLFIKGKYSQLSREAKTAIEKYHTFNYNKIPIHVYAVLYPHTPMALLDKMTPIEYVAYHYGINEDELKKIGEIGSVFDGMTESLITDTVELCK